MIRIPPHVNPKPMVFSEPEQTVLKSGEYECERCKAPVPADGYIWNHDRRSKTCVACMATVEARGKKKLHKTKAELAAEKGAE